MAPQQEEFVTNTVLLTKLHKGRMLTAFARKKCSVFGDVDTAFSVPEDPAKVVVRFYDVRAAERAIQGLGSDSCVRLPSSGVRTVTVPGDAPITLEETDCTSGIVPDEEDPSKFVLEFFDTRKAAEYQAKVDLLSQADTSVGAPPGFGPQAEEEAACRHTVPMPPGLSPPSPPPGFKPTPEPAEAERPVWKVCISKLPNKLLGPEMLECVLEQAGLEDVVEHYEVKQGRPTGEVTVHLASYEAAMMCEFHFKDCQWGQAGAYVQVTVTPPCTQTFRQEVFLEAALDLVAPSVAFPMALSAEAPVFTPSIAQEVCTLRQEADTPASSSSDCAESSKSSASPVSDWTFSAAAAVFVPASVAKLPEAPKTDLLPTAGIASDMSTDTGSESEERTSSETEQLKHQAACSAAVGTAIAHGWA